MLGDYFLSLIRTFVPVIVGGIISWLSMHGVDVSDDMRYTAATSLTVLAALVYYTLARTLEGRWPILGRYLLGSAKAPTYPVLPQDHTVTQGPGDVPSTYGE